MSIPWAQLFECTLTGLLVGGVIGTAIGAGAAAVFWFGAWRRWWN